MEIKTLSYYEFADLWSEKRARDLRAQNDAHLELTRLCNLRCTHCYIGDARWKRDPSELTTAEWKRFMDGLAEREVLWLFFTGGEAMARPDFRELWLHAKERGFLLTLYSNATLIDEKMGAFLADYPAQRIEVSIYGATAATYEKVTGVRGSHQRFLRGIEEIRRRGFHWHLKAPVFRDLLPELEEARALAASWGVPLYTDTTIQASIGEGESGGKAPCATRVPEAELVEYEMATPLYRASAESAAKGCSHAHSGEGGEGLYQCGAGLDTFYVTAGGKMQMCLATAHHGIDWEREQGAGSQIESARRAFARIRESQRDPSSPCFACDLQTLCANCPGMARLETGDEQGAVAWICRHTHLKAHALGLPHKCDLHHPVYESTLNDK